MKDTPAEVRQRYRELMIRKDGAERLKMGCDMFTAARELALAGLSEESGEKIQERLFERFYGRDFQKDQRIEIEKRLRACARGAREKGGGHKQGEEDVA